MSDAAEVNLNFLLFSVDNVHFGIDADQVAEVDLYDGKENDDDDLFWFHRELGYGDDAVVYLSPVIVAIKSAGAESYRMIIDAMADIVAISQDDIRLFPPLLEPFVLQCGMWGIVPSHGKMVFLVDPIRLMEKRRLKK